MSWIGSRAYVLVCRTCIFCALSKNERQELESKDWLNHMEKYVDLTLRNVSLFRWAPYDAISWTHIEFDDRVRSSILSKVGPPDDFIPDRIGKVYTCKIGKENALIWFDYPRDHGIRLWYTYHIILIGDKELSFIARDVYSTHGDIVTVAKLTWCIWFNNLKGSIRNIPQIIQMNRWTWPTSWGGRLKNVSASSYIRSFS